MAASSRKCPKAFDSYVRGKLLGSGAFANVYACRKSDDEEQIFAVKAVDLHAMRLSGRGERELKKLQREASILKRVKAHANVVQFVDLVESEDWYLFILEFVQGGNLLQTITKRQGLKEFEVLCIFRQLVDGLQHLHSEDVIHRDLKLENILVVQEGSAKREFKVKITDFGLSKEVGDGMSAACSMVGSPKYVAPEVIALGEHDFKADLWSLGILLFVLLGNRFPFDGNSQAAKESQEKVDAELFKMAVSEPARLVLLGLLRHKAEERLSLETLSSHEWLTSVSSSTPKGKRRKLTAQSSAPSPRSPSAAMHLQAASAGSRDLVCAVAASSAAMAIATVATPNHPEIAVQNRRRSWVDCTPEVAEANFNSQQEKLQQLITRGFDSTMAEIALQSADWNVDTAILMLEG